jgi:hypothetical protein
MQMGGPSPLVSGAALLRLDVYAASVACTGASVADGSGMPEMSHSFTAAEKISLQVPPGAYTLELTTFADAAGTVALGQGCTPATLSARAQICFDLTLSAVPPAMTMPTFDGGCSEITSVTNCGACGAVCSIAADNSARLCADGACMYTCATGHFDCNQGTGTDTDGCECNVGTGCCPATDGGSGGGCQSQHTDGVGQTFFDCAPTATYTHAQALAACTAYAISQGGSASNCESTGCGGGDLIVCSDNPVGGKSLPCNCWGYAGACQGNVATPSDNFCGCGDGSGWTTWN